MSKRPSDIDLMRYADGELSAAEEREVAELLEGEERADQVVAGVREVGEAVRTHLERETDEAIQRSPRFDRLWSEIERRIHANGASAQDETEAEPSRPAVEEAPGMLERFLSWLREHRGHMVTGVVAAGATAAILLVALPRERVRERIVEREVRVEVPADPVKTSPAALESRPPEVENLEVYDGSGMVLTIPGEEEEGGGTAVIWLTPDEDTTEGPI